MNRKFSPSILLIAISLFVILFVFFLYTFLHESGHAIAGALFGQSLTVFDVSFWDFSAHVGMIGDMTDSQRAVQALAGASLPFLLWVLFISLVPRKSSFTLEVLKLLASMMVINTLLPWIILPILFLLGKAPADDVTNFLRYSEMPPLLLAFTALILYAGGWVLFLSKINGLRNEFLLFAATDPAQITAGARWSIPILTGIMTLCVIMVLGLNVLAEKNLLDPFVPPPDFAPVAQLDLSKQVYSSETLTQFTLDKSTNVEIFVTIRNIDTTYFDLSVTGPNGFKSTVLHGEEYSADQDGGLWQENLPAGAYQVVLTSHQSPGFTSIYLKVR